jgi:PST family polysaccharide transporter
MRDQVMKLGMWSSLLQMARVGINGIVFLIVIRWMPIREVGLFGTSMSIIAFAQIFVRLGVLETYIREKEPTKEFKDTSFWISCGIGAAAGLVIAGIGLVYLLFTGLPRQGLFLLVLACVPLFDSIGIVPEAMLRRNLTFKALAVRTFLATAISGVIAIAAGALGFEGWALVGFSVITPLLSSLLALSMCGWSPSGGLASGMVRPILVPALQITAAGFGSASIVPTTQILVGVIAGPAAAGAYAIAQRFLLLANSFVIEPARQVALPILTGLNDKPAARNAALCEAVAFLTTIAVPIYLGMFAISDGLLTFLVGPNGRSASPIFQGLAWSFPPMIISMLVIQLQTTIGRQRDSLTFTSIQAAVNAVVSAVVAWVAVEQIGIALSVRGFVVIPIIFWQAWRHGHIHPLAILRAVLPPIPAGLVMTLAIFGANRSGLVDGLGSGLATLMAQVLIGAIVYPIALRVIAPRHFSKALASAMGLLRRKRPSSIERQVES